MRYEARAPLRIDFGGGWTDVPLYAEKEGGAVLNAAITQYVRGHISKPTVPGPLARIRSDRSYVTYSLELPEGAGLGASAAETLLWVTLVKTTIANVSERRELAEIACDVSRLLGILGGKQDEYASALGGIGYYTFGSTVEVERLELDPAFVERFLDRLVLAYSGVKRVSGSIHEAVWSRYAAGDAEVAESLATLRRVAGEMRSALLAHDLEGFADLMNENWTHQKRLSPGVTNRALESLIGTGIANGAAAAKACGAGGGGCVLFVTREGRRDGVRAALARQGFRLIDFAFDTYGVYLNKG